MKFYLFFVCHLKKKENKLCILTIHTSQPASANRQAADLLRPNVINAGAALVMPTFRKQKFIEIQKVFQKEEKQKQFLQTFSQPYKNRLKNKT